MTKTIRFTVSQLIIDGQQFNIDSFDQVINAVIDTKKNYKIETGEMETTSIKKVEKKVYNHRFISLYFNYGDKFPYPPKVITADLSEHDNPRSPDEIELRDQLFVLIDIQSQRIYFSGQRNKAFIKHWLTLKIKKEIIIKSIIQEEEFASKIKSINSILFTVQPSLFTAAGTLSASLVQDIYGFDAEKAKVELIYNNKPLTENILDKIKSLIMNKEIFDQIVVIGRDDEEFESIFNSEEVTSKLLIDANADSKSELFSPENVFNALIEKIN